MALSGLERHGSGGPGWEWRQGRWACQLEFPKVMLHFESDILFAEGLPLQSFDGEVRAGEQRPEGLREHRVFLKIVERLFECSGETPDAAACAFLVRVIAGVNQGRLAKFELALHAIQ